MDWIVIKLNELNDYYFLKSKDFAGFRAESSNLNIFRFWGGNLFNVLTFVSIQMGHPVFTYI